MVGHVLIADVLDIVYNLQIGFYFFNDTKDTRKYLMSETEIKNLLNSYFW